MIYLLRNFSFIVSSFILAGVVEVCKYLMGQWSCPVEPGRTSDGATPLWMACKSGNLDLVICMIKDAKKKTDIATVFSKSQVG